jgi:Raf kinase inhibitor-like YbhB/YbcL family protein
MAMKLIIPAFAAGGIIPRVHTCDGADLSPAIEWTGEPAGSKSFALIVDDPDAPAGTWNHWLLWDLRAAVHSLAQGWKPRDPGRTGTNDFGKKGYGGPYPPRGHGPHRYFFRLYVLDVASLSLEEGSRRAALDRTLKNHILAHEEYMGRYRRR